MKEGQRIHFIAIGGSVMHALAIALKKAGHTITGSDDQFFSPSKEALAKHQLLPTQEGYRKENIHTDLDIVILGMHAKKDNPELIEAQKKNIEILSFPEFLRKFADEKQRIVIAGSHGKSTITTIIAHVLRFHNRKFDFVSGAKTVDGQPSLHISNDAPIIILEGDEYLSSPLDNTPKFLHYDHHSVLITGIAWDHINVFPTEDVYVEAFQKLIDKSPKSCTTVYFEDDKRLRKMVEKSENDCHFKPYKTLKNKIKNGQTYIINHKKEEIKVSLFGEHNMQNLAGAKEMLASIGINDQMFFEAITAFKGAHKRLNILREEDGKVFIRDFAHAPSKVKASVKATKDQFKGDISAFLELHTFSSLNKEYLANYKDSLKGIKNAFIYINPDVVAKKGNGNFSQESLAKAFNVKNLTLIEDTQTLEQKIIETKNYSHTLLMSSGTFDGVLNKFL